MYSLLIIGIGGFIGAVLRYIISGIFQGQSNLPFGTLSVNVIGSFMISLILYLTEYQGFFKEDVRIFLTIGLLGAFTTMSSFTFESFKLFEQGKIWLFALNIFANIILCLGAVYLGKISAVMIAERIM